MQHESLTAREKLKAEYERTGELPEASTRIDLMLRKDFEAYMARDPHAPRSSFEEFKSKYDAFVKQVFRTALDTKKQQEPLPDTLPKSKALNALLLIKSAFQKNAGTTYNRDNDTVADPVLDHKYQCRSGTLSLILLMLKVSPQENFCTQGETFVEVYTQGHVEPGLLFKDDTLIALEMTSAGSGIRNFGKMHAIQEPIQVVRADHATYQDALGTIAHRDKAILFEDELVDSITDPMEKQCAKDYLVLHRTVMNYYHDYGAIFKPMAKRLYEHKTISSEELTHAEENMARIAHDLDQYANANSLDAKYDEVKAILTKYGLYFTLKKPSEMVRIMHELATRLREGWEASQGK